MVGLARSVTFKFNSLMALILAKVKAEALAVGAEDVENIGKRRRLDALDNFGTGTFNFFA